MSSTSPEIPIESGSYSDMKVWDVNAVAEPIMRNLATLGGALQNVKADSKEVPTGS